MKIDENLYESLQLVQNSGIKLAAGEFFIKVLSSAKVILRENSPTPELIGPVKRF